ncbi:MAG: type II secretion system protein GspF [Desulfuromonas sp.]|nr:MAG: type II secretion system protein GspF [Desulfuromonas sp.]
MPLFAYSGFDVHGKKVSGTIEGSGRRAALQLLREKGIFASQLQEESKTSRSTLRLPGRNRVSNGVLAGATRQLATLLGAGLPLDETLATVAGQIEHPRLQRSLSQVREEVIQGESLNSALGRHSSIFPPLYVNMAQVGESSGTLDQVLRRLADFLEDQERTASRIRAAMLYPILMAVVGTGVMALLLTFVVPKVTRMLEDLDQALPLPTLLLIRSSDFLASYWWALLLLAIAGGFALRRYLTTDEGETRFHRLLLRLPLFSRLSLQVVTSRLCRTLSTLLHSGVPLLTALEISRNLVGNRILSAALEETSHCVREGEGLAPPLQRSGLFPPMLSQMAAIGEKSGELEEMLMRVAEAYEHQVEISINGLLSLLEPLMILVMAVVVGFIVLAILLPIFQVTSGMG